MPSNVVAAGSFMTSPAMVTITVANSFLNNSSILSLGDTDLALVSLGLDVVKGINSDKNTGNISY